MNDGFVYTDRIGDDGVGETVLGFYSARYPHSTPEQWRERIEQGVVRLDGGAVAPSARLLPGQTLTYARAPWREPEAPREFGVLYRDAELLAVDKPSGLPVLPGGHHLEGTLLALVRERYDDIGDFAPSPLHRLGRATSGIVLFARTRDSYRRMSRAFAERRVTKIYRALVSGVDFPTEISVDAPIGRVAYAPTRMLYAATPDGAPSLSVFRRMEERLTDGATLVEARIVTGRAHQIRIHAAAIGHPLAGDPLYASGGGPRPLVAGRAPLPGDGGYHLHAMRVAFEHPTSGERVEILSPPPALLATSEERAGG